MPSFAPYFGCKTADSVAVKLEQLEKMKEGSIVLKPDLRATATKESLQTDTRKDQSTTWGRGRAG